MNEWSYYVLGRKNPQVLGDGFQADLDVMGADGWELVTALTTVKTMINVSGNDLLFVFKKPGLAHRPPNAIVYGSDADGPAY